MRSKVMPPNSDAPFRTPAQAAKMLMVLGLLQDRPRHGYDLHRIVVAHGALYAELKKPTLYNLLERLSEAGLVSVRTEGGARGREGKRFIYEITAAGRNAFDELLIIALSADEAAGINFEIAVAFIDHLPVTTAIQVLGERRRSLERRHAALTEDLRMRGTMFTPRKAMSVRFAGEHALALMAAEINWIDNVKESLANATNAAKSGGRTSRRRLRARPRPSRR